MCFARPCSLSHQSARHTLPHGEHQLQKPSRFCFKSSASAEDTMFTKANPFCPREIQSTGAYTKSNLPSKPCETSRVDTRSVVYCLGKFSSTRVVLWNVSASPR